MLSVSGVHNGNVQNCVVNRSKTNAKPNFTSWDDSIFYEQYTQDKSKNGKFDWSEAGKNFLKGVISPLTAVIKHPIATLGIVAGTVAACSFVPILGPALAIGFGAYSLAQLGKGFYDVAKNCSNGDYDKVEKSFDTVGQGTVGTILSALGIRQSASVAKEAKLMSELGVTSLSEAQKAEIVASAKNAGFYNNLKETLSLFTTKNGLKASFAQFKPDMLKARWNDIKNIFTKTKIKKEVREEKVKKHLSHEERIAQFKKSPEGIRRAALTDEQIEAEVNSLYERVFDELKIPKEQRPKIEIKSADAIHGGGYNQGLHTIEFNPESYKAGVFEIENVVMHEATHCREALLRASIPQEQVDAIVQKELINRVINGESEQVIKGANLVGAEMVEPPKMSAGMKNDFVQFAKDNLYTKDANVGKMLKHITTDSDAASLLDKLKMLIKQHPEFAKQYKSESEAINALAEYSLAHNFRYNYFTNVKIRSGYEATYNPEGQIVMRNKYLDIGELSPEELAHAKQSLIDNITTIEGNGRTSGFKIFGVSQKEFNQYQFSPEEVLAQKNGNNFLIDTIQAKMEAMRKAGTLSAEDEAYLTGVIKKAKAVIAYKTKGLEYYKKYTQLLNNPNDKALAETVKALQKELAVLNENIHADEYQILTRVVRTLKLPTHAAVSIPSNAIYEIISALKDLEK